MPSDQIVAKIVEILDKTDDGAAAAPGVATMPGCAISAKRQALEQKLDEKTVMRAIDFFKTNNLALSPEFCGGVQSILRNLGAEVASSDSSSNPMDIESMVGKIGDELFQTIPATVRVATCIVLECMGEDARCDLYVSTGANITN